MPTPGERKALIFFSSVIVLGGATRLYRSHADPREVDARSVGALGRQIAAVDSAIAVKSSGKHRGKRSRRTKSAPSDPPAAPAIIDLDIASVDQIETLRWVGPALAERIVADRDSFGAFGTIEGLDRVRGIGPALAGKLAPYVTFSGVPRPVNTVVSRRSAKTRLKRKATRRKTVY